MKKVLSILLCLAFLWSTAPAMEAAGYENFLKNPSFEQNKSWFSGGGGSVTTAKKRTGSGSAVLTSKGSGVWFAQMGVPAFPGTEYELSAYFLQNEALTNGVRFKVEFYTDAECTKPQGWTYSPYMDPKTDGEWHLHSYVFTAPEDIYGFVVYIRLDTAGTLYADDVVLRATTPIPALSISTEQAFYYTEWGGNVTATVRMHPTFYPELTGGTVKLSLHNGTQAVDEKIYPYQETLTYMPALSLLAAEGKEYTVRATAYDSSQKEIYTATAPVYRFDRPTLLDDEGNIRINNQPFIPVYFYYNTYTAEGMAREKALGANAIILENWMMPDPDQIEDTLDLCQENGMKALLRLYYKMKPAGHPDNVEIVETVLERIHDHPAVLGYILMDEPGGILQIDYEDDLLNSYLLVRKYDKVHPAVINEAPRALLGVAGRYCDILSHDPYPGQTAADANAYSSLVAEGIKIAVEAVEGKKPVYAVLQAFDYQYFNPNSAQLRHMIYQALAAGAKGIGYYSQRAIWNTNLKGGLLEFATREQTAALTVVNNPTVVQEDTATYAARTWQAGGDTYLLLVNLGKDTPATGSVYYLGDKEPGMYAVGDGSGVTFTKGIGRYTFTIAAGGAALYKFPEREATAHLFTDAFHTHLKDGSGSLLSEVRGGTNFTVRVFMANATAEVKQYFGAAALYEINGKQKELLRIAPFSPVVPAAGVSGTGQYQTDLRFVMEGLPRDGAYAVKLLLWNKDGTLAPSPGIDAGIEMG